MIAPIVHLLKPDQGSRGGVVYCHIDRWRLTLECDGRNHPGATWVWATRDPNMATCEACLFNRDRSKA